MTKGDIVDEIVIDANMVLIPTLSHWCQHPADDAEDPRDGLEAPVDVEEAQLRLMKTHKLVMKPPHT